MKKISKKVKIICVVASFVLVTMAGVTATILTVKKKNYVQV